MRIAVGCDHNALELKNVICEFLKEKGVEYKDFGVNSSLWYWNWYGNCCQQSEGNKSSLLS